MTNETTKGQLLVGVVSDLRDPDGLARVKVTYPELDNAESDWAPLVTLMAGGKRGSLFRPDVGDEVLVGFLQGDMRAPYVLGGIWNAPEPPPADDGNPTQNNWRYFKSRSGHILRFDDTDRAERIEVIAAPGKTGGRTLSVVLDTAKQKIVIRAGGGDVEVSAPKGAITLTGKSITLEATGEVTIKGSRVDIN